MSYLPGEVKAAPAVPSLIVPQPASPAASTKAAASARRRGSVRIALEVVTSQGCGISFVRGELPPNPINSERFRNRDRTAISYKSKKSRPKSGLWPDARISRDRLAFAHCNRRIAGLAAMICWHRTTSFQ